jgi:Ca2+/Na+ antiporter
MGIGALSIWQVVIICFFVLLYLLARKTFKKSQKIETPQIADVNSTSLQASESIVAPPNTPTTNPGDTGVLKGWVYVATMENTIGVVRIGYSERDPQQIIDEWSAGQAGEPRLAYAVLVEEPQEYESRVHQRLSEFITRGEWSKYDLGTVVTAIQESGTVLYESRVHQRLSEFRTRGEWFKCDLGTVVTAIQESGTVLYADDRRS